MRNVCNVRMTQAMGDVIFGIGIGIGIGTAAADSIGYRAPTRYRSNPNCEFCISILPLPYLERYMSLMCDLKFSTNI